MSDELKTAVKDLTSAFEEYKKVNDARLEALKAGQGTSDFEEKLAKINGELDRLQDQVTKASRLPLPGKQGGQMTADEQAHVKSFLRFVRKGKEDGLVEAQEKALKSRFDELEIKAMSVGSDPDGGFLVPTDMSGRMVKKIYETTPMRQYADVQGTSSDRLEGETDLDEAGAGWTSETGTRSESDTPEVGKWAIVPEEMYAEPRQTQKFLDDAASDVESWLANKVAERFSRLENNAFVNGNGISKPRGFCAYTTVATADSSRSWGQLEHVVTGANGAFNATNPQDYIIDLIYRLKAAYRAGAVFMAPRLVWADVRKFKDSEGQYLWQPSHQAGQPATLYGYPAVEAEDMPAKATGSLSLAFGNFREGYLIVDRMGIRVLRDPYTAKPYVKFYTTKRVGGGVINFEAIKFLKFSA